MEKPLVSVVMVTYNQENYIEQSIRSVLNQNTDFSIELVIGEDCSTDNTRTICEKLSLEFPNTIVLLEKQPNLGLFKNYQRCFENCRGEFIAILEGDDYWIDELKLQNQIELIQEDSAVGLVHSNYKTSRGHNNIVGSVSQKLNDKCIELQGKGLYAEVLLANFICAGTALFRSEYLKNINFKYFIDKHCNTIDFILWLEISQHAAIKYLDRPTLMYRILDTSISNNKSFAKLESFYCTKFNIVEYYLAKYPLVDVSITKIRSMYDTFLFFKAVKIGKSMDVIKYLRRLTFIGLRHTFKAWRIN
ncbi:glycosyltransferase family 2 protein [Sphingobacterium siyangense]|uniref:Glycosyl transferase family 2 n=1 Tax=Sphingobacterium siyangense TaxID=459529 RepID=A0A562MJC3_9SPHI|nr:glycosyltransferase [Sphingobacterium siyangense]TWI19960.1 glycosyl transferase family 2 [Sphingobacterium siyangense]